MKQFLNILFLLVFSVTTLGQNLKISDLTSLTNASLATNDVFPIVDTSAVQTKKFAVSEFDLRYAFTVTAPLSKTAGASPVVSIPLATSSADGYLSSANWTTFNAKEPAITVLPIAKGGTNNGSLGVTNGGAVYADGSKLATTAAGTSGQFLKSNGAGAPTWANVTVTPVAFLGSTSAAPNLTTSATAITFTAVSDTNSGWSTNTYTIPTTGNYTITGQITLASASFTQGKYIILEIFKNGSTSLFSKSNYIQFTGTQQPQSVTFSVGGIPLNATDTLQLRGVTDEGTRTLSAFTQENFFSIVKD